MIDFNIISLWTLQVVIGIWLLSVYGFSYQPLVLMSDMVFWLILAYRGAMELTWLPSTLDIKTWTFYYG